MKIIYYLIFFGLFVITQGYSQITEAEYFIDTDPGVGNGTTLSVTNGNAIDEVFTIPTSGLSEGIHFLHIRVKGTDAFWSLYYFDSFYVFNPNFPDGIPPITEAEYFIDNDPGAGQGEPLNITSGYDINENFSIPVADELADGNHLLYIRVKTTIGDWTPYIFDNFTVDRNLSLDQFDETSYSLFPNPISDFLNISFKGTSDYSIAIVDMQGRELLFEESISGSSGRLDFSKYAKGIYLIKLTDKNLKKTRTVKVIKS